MRQEGEGNVRIAENRRQRVNKVDLDRVDICERFDHVDETCLYSWEEALEKDLILQEGLPQRSSKTAQD